MSTIDAVTLTDLATRFVKAVERMAANQDRLANAAEKNLAVIQEFIKRQTAVMEDMQAQLEED